MRYEIKYAVSHLSHEAIVAQIMTHPASFTTLFPDRQVNNIYFDTPSFNCFHQNVEGHPRRKKMRLRWYGTDRQPTYKSVLEIKQKDKELGWKDTFKISADITDRRSLMAAVNTVGILQSELGPVLHNTYVRSYLLSQDGIFRITVDRVQTFSMPFSGMRSLETTLYPVIIELKFDAEHATRLQDVTRYLNFRQTKNSKYANGVEELYF